MYMYRGRDVVVCLLTCKLSWDIWTYQQPTDGSRDLEISLPIVVKIETVAIDCEAFYAGQRRMHFSKDPRRTVRLDYERSPFVDVLPALVPLPNLPLAASK